MDEFREKKLEEKQILFEKFKQYNTKRRWVRYVVKQHTKWVDVTLAEFFRYIDHRNDLAVVGVGGYGRRQLNPHSDIDILIVCKNPASVEGIPSKLSDLFFYLGYDCSVSVRTPAECFVDAQKDLTIKTALLDARFIYGSRDIFDEFGKVYKKILEYKKDEFIEAHLEYLKNRHKKYGSTVFMLEPNVKEGVGGLRDYHTLLWISKVLFNSKNIIDLKRKGKIIEEDYSRFRDALYFLWQLRNALHFASNRKNDILFLDMREKIATQLDFSEEGRFSKVERLMRKFYYSAGNIQHIVSFYLELFLNNNKTRSTDLFFISDRMSINDKLECRDIKDFDELLFCFYYAAVYQKPLDTTIKQISKKIFAEIPAKRSSTTSALIFREILSVNKPVSWIVRDMHGVSLLDRYIPEFGNIYCLTEDSLYHKYTVDEHSIKSIEEIEKLYDYDTPKTFITRLAHIFKSLKPHQRFILRLTLLLHDIGKIKKQKHEIVGAELSKDIAKRLKLGKDLSEMLYFLIKHHLFISRLISTRDIDDEKTIEEFLKVVDNKEKLNLLMLLTYADMKAVNDNVWTSWKEDLIEALYLKATFSFENRSYDEYLHQYAEDSKRKIRGILGENYNDLIDVFPDSIFKDIDSDSMAEYIKTIKDTKRHVFVYKKDGISKIVVYYKNVFGFFNKISGVLACFDINIVTAKSYNLSNGYILDIFSVQLPDDKPISDFEVEDMLYQAKEGKFDLDRCMDNKNNRYLSRLERAKLEISVTNVDVLIDNDASDIYTVIRIYAPDKVGLVYFITKVFVDLKLQVGMFILDTRGSMAVDTFYVVDENFRKIYASKLIDLIKGKLYEVLI